MTLHDKKDLKETVTSSCKKNKIRFDIETHTTLSNPNLTDTLKSQLKRNIQTETGQKL